MNTPLFNSEVAALYSELERIRFDTEETEFTFVKRITSENGWRIKYAERVLVEYRRFVVFVLLKFYTHTPSDAVDQVWHLHLVYSRSYWEELCGRFLQKQLHHQPMDGAGKDREVFYAQYNKTLVCYRETFGEDAPNDIWPQAAERVSEIARFQRVDMKDYNSKMSRCKAFVLISAVLLFFINNAVGGSTFFAFFSALLYTMFLNIVFGVNTIETGEVSSGSSCGGGCGGGG